MKTLVTQFVNELFDNNYAYTAELMKYYENIKPNDWIAFQNSWNNLYLDCYMGDGGRYRYRRYSVFHWDNTQKTITLKPHEPHYQSLTYNSLNGGIARYYEPFEKRTINCLSFKQIMNFALDVINQFEPSSNWHIEAHQFRIIGGKESAKPTPEGIHCDGRDYIIMVMINKQNVLGGISSIYDNNKKLLTNINLCHSGETIMVCDNNTMHEVSPITIDDHEIDGFRDMLVITFINEDKLS